MTLKVMVVDDTIFYRKIIKDVLEAIPDVEISGTVNSGALALHRIPALKPDIITLDVEMPGMSGLQLLEEIRKNGWDVEVIMISSKTHAGSEATIRALELGAFDFIAKPDEATVEANLGYLTDKITRMINVLKRQLEMRKMFKKDRTFKAATPPATGAAPTTPAKTAPAFKRTEKSAVVALGISTGGPNALAKVLPQLPGDIGVPILLVQHMPPVFSASLATSLNKKCALTVKEAEDGDKVELNTVYIAPGGKQMKVTTGASMTKIIRITDDPPENNCKPAADYLIRSVARIYGAKTTCVIMTGMGTDGKLGVTVARAAGAITIAQDAETSVVYGMPKAVIDAGMANVVAPLDRIASEILKTLK